MSGYPAWVRVGAKVVCIDDKASSSLRPLHNGDMGGLTKGRVYTISALDVGWRGTLTIHLAECVRPNSCGFQLSRFRPAVPPKTEAEDLELFTPFLEPPLVRIPHRGTVRA